MSLWPSVDYAYHNNWLACIWEFLRTIDRIWSLCSFFVYRLLLPAREISVHNYYGKRARTWGGSKMDFEIFRSHLHGYSSAFVFSYWCSIVLNFVAEECIHVCQTNPPGQYTVCHWPTTCDVDAHGTECLCPKNLSMSPTQLHQLRHFLPHHISPKLKDMMSRSRIRSQISV